MSDLGPIIAAVLGPMLLFVAASMRYQHVDSIKTRELIAESIERANKENRRLIKRANKETRRLIDRNYDLIMKNHDLIMKNHDLIMNNQAGLSDVRERLARMEGFLRTSPPPEQGTEDGDNNAHAA